MIEGISLKPSLAILSPRPPWMEGGIERTVGETVTRLSRDFDIVIYRAARAIGLFTTSCWV